MSTSSIPYSVKSWQINGTDYEQPQSRSLSSDTVFSSWTPLNNKANNQQLFQKRVGLVMHWFDLWTDRQRKYFLHSLLSQCTSAQLKYCRDLLIETLPVTRVDFTTVLPRFLSLYVLSFLSPRDLSSAAQVCWNWRVLAEQDCLWVRRCIQKGWFLPYTPSEKEYGAWKKHYVSCVSTLDWLTPREAAQLYGTLNQRSSEGGGAEEEEKRKEQRIRQIIRERLQHEKSEVMRTRKAWGSNTKSVNTSRFTQSRMYGITAPSSGSPPLWPSTSIPSQRPDEGRESMVHSLKTNEASALVRSLSQSAPSDLASNCPRLLLLISDRIPAYEMVLCGVKAGVNVLLYDQRQTLSALLSQVEKALSGHRALRLGLLAPGGTKEVHLLQRSALSEETLLAPDHREFWEKMSFYLTRAEGGIDIFCPLAASASGVSLMQNLSALTGVEVRAPMGLATGSFQNILGEWSDASFSAPLSKATHHQASPTLLQYIHDSAAQSWAMQALWIETSLDIFRSSVATALPRVSAQVRARALGHYFYEKIYPTTVSMSTALNEALTEGLTAVIAQEEMRQVEFLSAFLTKHVQVSVAGESPVSQGQRPEEIGVSHSITHSAASVEPKGPPVLLDWRGAVVREMYHSERQYLSRLGAVHNVYHKPLTAALNSNRAILSIADIHIILSPVSHILELNSALQADLHSRLQQWSAQQCVGVVFIKFCLKLRVYTNYFNNYSTALNTIDKCRENKPSFRAFLKRTDRTLSTHMLSLQELLLCPLWRIQEYFTLLQALSLHTPPGHADHSDLLSALSTLREYIHFLQKLKQSSRRDRLMKETQKMIHGCPSLIEGNRQLITTQNCALYTSPDDHAPDSIRTFEHVADLGLFLFSDALVLTRCSLHQIPFSVAQSCTHTFEASVALCKLTVREIAHSRYVSHAFVLEGPCHSWVCATDSEVDRKGFLSVLQTTIETALTEYQA